MFTYNNTLENKILISIVSGFLNMLLSITVPCLLKNNNRPLLKNIKMVFNNNKKLIITSSLLVSILTYLALTVTDELENIFSEDSNVKIVKINEYMPSTSDVFYSQGTADFLKSTEEPLFTIPQKPNNIYINDSSSSSTPDIEFTDLNTPIIPNNNLFSSNKPSLSNNNSFASNTPSLSNNNSFASNNNSLASNNNSLDVADYLRTGTQLVNTSNNMNIKSADDFKNMLLKSLNN
jgi:hypothetical protein